MIAYVLQTYTTRQNFLQAERITFLKHYARTVHVADKSAYFQSSQSILLKWLTLLEVEPVLYTAG